MKIPDKKILIVLASCLLLVIGVAGAALPRRQAQEKRPPKVISKVKNLEVVGVSVREEGQPTAELVIDIHNKSEKPVVAVSVECGDAKDASGVEINGDIGDDQPTAVIEPYGRRTVKLSISNLLPGKPIKIVGAIYADGSEDGEPVTLGAMHEHRKRDKAETLKRKGGSKP